VTVGGTRTAGTGIARTLTSLSIVPRPWGCLIAHTRDADQLVRPSRPCWPPCAPATGPGVLVEQVGQEGLTVRTYVARLDSCVRHAQGADRWSWPELDPATLDSQAVTVSRDPGGLVRGRPRRSPRGPTRSLPPARAWGGDQLDILPAMNDRDSYHATRAALRQVRPSQAAAGTSPALAPPPRASRVCARPATSQPSTSNAG
jgi:hypothetical protein